MLDTIRDAPVGQLVRYLTRNRVLLYPEEKADFQIPDWYIDAKVQGSEATISTTRTLKERNGEEKTAYFHKKRPSDENAASGNQTPDDPDKEPEDEKDFEVLDQVSNHNRANSSAKNEEPIIATWYSDYDPENPNNWSMSKKILASGMVDLYTLAVYMASSIVTPSTYAVMEKWNVSITVASLTLALYVLAYGIGPLIWSPLSEIAKIGRNPPYVVTMGIFVVLSVPAAMTDSFAGLLVLRFLQGFFGSPCLATGGASIGDIFGFTSLAPYMLCIWALAATGGPALGPIISGYSVPAMNWRWAYWEILWLAGPTYIGMLLFLPETFGKTILLRRAQRLRKLTGDNRIKAQSELDEAKAKPKEIAFEALVRPIQLMVMDPAIGFTALYSALCYAIFYSFFESFPLVYGSMYNMSPGSQGLTFLSLMIGALISVALYMAYLKFILEPQTARSGLGPPERRLIPALYASFLTPAGLFVFAWTSDPGIHWVVSCIGVAVFCMGVMIIMQCIFVYLAMVYPQYVASLFAGNDFARSSVAFSAILWARPMMINLGVGPGVSLLGGLTAGCIAGVYVLFFFGDKLRARSRFSAKY